MSQYILLKSLPFDIAWNSEIKFDNPNHYSLIKLMFLQENEKQHSIIGVFTKEKLKKQKYIFKYQEPDIKVEWLPIGDGMHYQVEIINEE